MIDVVVLLLTVFLNFNTSPQGFWRGQWVFEDLTIGYLRAATGSVGGRDFVCKTQINFDDPQNLIPSFENY